MAKLSNTAAFSTVRILALAWMLGSVAACVRGSEPSDGDTASQTESLTGPPITVTLSTPNPVPVLSPVVGVSNSMFLGAGANIVSGPIVAMGSAGGGIHAEPDAVLNDTWSRGLAELRDRVRVRGTLHAASRTLGNGVVVTASDLTPPFDPPSTLSWTVRYPSSVPGANVTLNIGESQSLAPGQYGNLVLNSGGTATLHSGTYYLTTFDIESAGTINLDQANGPIIIYATNTLILRGTIAVVGGGTPDLMIGYLGTTPFLVETLFNGALIAPSTTVTLRAVTGIHTGYFSAKDFQILDAHAQVQYRAPLSVIAAANPPGTTCQKLVASLVPAGTLRQNLARYCKSCPSPDDTDRDGIQDCLDACPYDPAKTQPGACGCGTPDTDTDRDGVPDCIGVDTCPNDPNNTSAGQCGCVGQAGLKPAGTPCNDTACPQSNATCNGAGVCGNRASCIPATGCRVATWRENTFWICPPTGVDGGAGATPLTESGAQAACSAKGLTLSRIDSLAENRFIAQLITSPIWIGANDISVSGTWRWSAPGNSNGDQFWSGGSTGSAVGHRFAYWAAGAPGAQRCAAMVPGTGRWTDVSCNESLGYVCEFHVPITRADGGFIQPPGQVHQPPRSDASCVPEDASSSLLPATFDELRAQYDASFRDVLQGAASNPPRTGSTCPEDPLSSGIAFNTTGGATCQFIPVPNTECISDSDCSKFGAGLLCRQTKDDNNCVPLDANAPVDGGPCVGHSRCGQLNCPDAATPCNQVEICNAGTEFDAGIDPTSNLDAQAFDPAKLFGGAIADGAPTAAYLDPPTGSGVEHSWCSMDLQNPNSVKPATQPSPNFAGHSGQGAKIKFDFNPDLTFDADAKPLSLGETDLKIHARARLGTSVTLDNFLGAGFTTSIFDASIGMKIDRCAINDVDDTKLTVFGLDLLSLTGIGIPKIDSRDPSGSPAGLHGFSTTCQQNLDKFQLFADRTKKAFRDAQQLVTQFNAAKALGAVLNGDLCKQIQVTAASVPFFPGGNDCPFNEPPETTINRFVDFYQGPGFGQVAQLKKVQSGLAAATSALKNAIGPVVLNFGGDPHEESQTIVNVPFAIGPVPMVLQIDVFAQYGVGGGFDLGLELPISMFTDPANEPAEIARAGVHVAPFAAAGLSAFVGAGFDLGAISATIGIEGMVTLADVSAPIYAGVGLDEQVTSDLRPIPDDILPAVVGPDSFQFGLPKSFKFFVTYEYGAAVDINNVLSGTINGRLRIKFFFFSRTWRKQIVKFNGWSKHIELISGGSSPAVSTTTETVPAKLKTPDNSPDTVGVSTQVSSGQSPMGRSEAQLPLMVLQRLPPAPLDDGGQGDGGVKAFDASAVQGFFYDDLCCVKGGASCSLSLAEKPQCCPGFTCFAPPAPPGFDGSIWLSIPTCVAECKGLQQDCKTTADCCQPDGGTAVVCGALNTCVSCIKNNNACSQNSDCCSGECDESGTCQDPIVVPK